MKPALVQATEPPAPAGSILSVDLDALADNWHLLAAMAGSAECAAVVKADAYGLGLAPVAGQLRSLGCRTFFVAHLSEGLELRSLLPDATIYVLNGLLPGAVPLCVKARLRPVLGSLPEIEEWGEVGGRAPCALQLDSGMTRLGLPASLQPAAARLSGRLELALVLSHLVWSGAATHRPAMARQVELFASARRHWPGVPGSLANSSGVFFGEAAHHDLVRPGYALYGGNPTPDDRNPMRTVVTFEAQVIQVEEVPAGTAVGYDARWIAPSPRRLATVSAGYADGVPCAALGTNADARGMAGIGGVRCPFVGRISMDLVVIDVTEAPPLRRGDSVELIGATIPIDEAARRAGTIGYEILTRLGTRSARRFSGGRAALPLHRVL